MKILILYYSYTGNCKRQAELLKEQDPTAELFEVKEKRRYKMFGTVLINCPKAALRKESAICEIEVNLKDYDKIIIVAPIWNGYPAPVFNSIVHRLPEKIEVELFLCSGGGETPKSKKGTCDLIKKANCKLIAYHDIKTVGTMGK